MTTKTFRTATADTDRSTPITVELTAASLEMTIEAVPGLMEATLELSGPEGVVNGATAHRTADRWTVDVPAPEPTVISGGGVTVMAGDVFGSVISGSGGEPVRATVRVPQESSLRVRRLSNGSVRARGRYTDVTFRSTNASLSAQDAVTVEADTTNGNVTVDGATELIDVTTTNGSVDLNGTAPRTRARATNGGIFVSASGPGRISARTTNGDITVLRNGHDVDVDTSTTNGRDRVR